VLNILSLILYVFKQFLMSKATVMGEQIIAAIETGQSIDSIKLTMNVSNDEWFKFSSKANQLYLKKQIKNRKAILSKPNTSGASKEEMDKLIKVNDTLADYALCMNIFTTQPEVDYAIKLIASLPDSKLELIQLISNITMHPKLRVLQKKGRIEKLPHFNLFTKMVDAATISYYRQNYISCYMTLLPVIEGIIIRWMGFEPTDDKPPFEKIRSFFKKTIQRQPCPYNILFHNIFIKACDKIINDHFYKPSSNGLAYGNFNRHVASHILNNEEFANKENCFRLFLLIDTMTEIYINEGRQYDHRFDLGREDTDEEVKLYFDIISSNSLESPEYKLLIDC
jgi:hypothetical protein